MADIDGTVSVEVKSTPKDAQGYLVSRTEVEERRICGHEEVSEFPGDCNIVTCPSTGDDWLWQIEYER